MFKYLKLKRENKQLRDTLQSQHKLIEQLISEISRRDQKIEELIGRDLNSSEQIQKKGAMHPDPLNFEFPGTEKSYEGFWDKFTDHINT